MSLSKTVHLDYVRIAMARGSPPTGEGHEKVATSLRGKLLVNDGGHHRCVGPGLIIYG